MSKNENSLIILPNAINKARFNLSLPTQKLFLYLVSKITYEERNQKLFLNTLEFSLEEIYSFLKSTGRENDKNLKGLLKECVNEIGNNNLKYSEIDERGFEYWANYPWSSKSEIKEKTGKFVFQFNDKISWFLLDLKSYFKSNEEEYMKLTSSHAISLYLLIRSNEFQNKVQSYYIEELKKNLGIETKYEKWIDFRTYVLDPSISQLNKETNYFFSYEAKRIGRSIGKVEIRVIDKKNKEEFSVFLSEKIQSFLKEKKADSNIRKRFEMVKYEYEAKENIIYIDYKDEASKTKIVEYYKSKQLEGEHPLKRFLDGFIIENQDFQKLLKNMFRKGLQVMYGQKIGIKK
jgi:plasmid replication initiation protein